MIKFLFDVATFPLRMLCKLLGWFIKAGLKFWFIIIVIAFLFYLF